MYEGVSGMERNRLIFECSPVYNCATSHIRRWNKQTELIKSVKKLPVWFSTLSCHLHYLGIWLATGDGRIFLLGSPIRGRLGDIFQESCQRPSIFQCLRPEQSDEDCSDFIMWCSALTQLTQRVSLNNAADSFFLLICLTNSCHYKHINNGKHPLFWLQLILHWMFRACSSVH